jgi:hypothetical protein
MNEEQINLAIAGLNEDVRQLKMKTEKPAEDKRKDFWISLVSSILVPVAITASGYWFSQAIKTQELNLTQREAKARDSLDNMHYQEQLKLSLQSQRLENYKFITPLLDILTSSDPKRRVFATSVILQIMPDEGPQLLNIAKATDPGNSSAYQATLDNRRQILIANLFSSDGTVRTANANELMVSWYKSPDIVKPLIDYAKAHKNNANGIFNTVIVLQNMSGQVLKIKKEDILPFLDEVIAMKDMVKTIINATALKNSLNNM